MSSFGGLADMARRRALEEMHKGHPAAAREWIEAAAAAEAAARGEPVAAQRPNDKGGSDGCTKGGGSADGP